LYIFAVATHTRKGIETRALVTALKQLKNVATHTRKGIETSRLRGEVVAVVPLQLTPARGLKQPRH